MRPLALLTLVVPTLAGAAGEAPPRGKRTARPKATHVIVAPTTLAAEGAKVELMPGAGVAVGRLPAKGKVRVTLTGDVAIAGSVEAAAVGRCVTGDVELKSVDGTQRLGTARAGALVRVLARKAPAGLVVVQTVAPLGMEAALPAEALDAEMREVVLKEDWNLETVKPAELHASSELKAPVARLEKGVRLAMVAQKGDVVHVRTHGAFVIDGWTLAANVTDRDPSSAEPPAKRVKPTHEVFVDTPLYARADGAKTIGTVRGGALVEAERRLVGDPTSRVKVSTLGRVKATGWMRMTDLRKLEDSVWSEDSK
jgi:hypothetical protein